MGNQNKFLSRITKTLYYGKLPKTDRLSLPMTGKYKIIQYHFSNLDQFYLLIKQVGKRSKYSTL